MSYRNPRFSYRHTLREYAGSGIDAATTDAVASGDLANLYDDRSSGLAEWAGAAVDKKIDLQKNAAAGSAGETLQGGSLVRVIIPKGHNLHNNRALGLQYNTEVDGGGSYVIPTFLDGVAYKYFAPSSNLLDIVLEAGQAHEFYSRLRLWLWRRLGATVNTGLGELWWTNIVQPTTGVSTTWDDTTNAISDRHETRSGARHNQKRGAPKRKFTLLHTRLPGADLRIYDDLYIGTGYGIYPFWYEHPDSGGAEVLVYRWDVLTGLAGTNSSTVGTTSARADGESGEVLKHTAGSQVDCEWSLPISSTIDPTNSDWRGQILRAQVKPNWAAAAQGDIKFFVESGTGTSYAARTYYEVGGAFALASENEWFRVEIDIDQDATSFSLEGPADLSNITAVGCYTNRDLVGSETRFGDLVLVRKTSLPVLVEILQYRRFQDSRSPSGASGPTYTIAMDLLEVTT